MMASVLCSLFLANGMYIIALSPFQYHCISRKPVPRFIDSVNIT